jgi:hypothetical protein
MHQRIQLLSHLSCEELERRSRSATEPQERRWWQVLYLRAHGQMAKQVAEQMGYSPYWIGEIAKRYNRDGPAGMRSRARQQMAAECPQQCAKGSAARAITREAARWAPAMDRHISGRMDE